MVEGILSARRVELLTAAIAALDEGRAAPDHQLLVEHEVTLEEAYTLAEDLALGARMLLQTNEDTASSSSLEKSVGMDRYVRAIMSTS